MIAPSFTETVRQIAKYVALGVDLTLYEYQAVENEKGEKGLICREVDYGEAPEPPRIISLTDKSKRIEDVKVKKLWDQIIAQIPSSQIDLVSRSGYSVTLWYKGKRFMWMGARRKWISAKVLSPAGGWGGLVNISTRKDWDKLFNGSMKRFMAHIDAMAET